MKTVYRNVVSSGTPDYREEDVALPDGTVKTVRICVACGAERVEGDWPDCKGDPEGHKIDMRQFHMGFEPYVDTQILPKTDPRCDSVNHLGIRGIQINSRSERQALMREQGLQYGTQKFEDRGKRLTFDMGRRG